MPRAGQYVQQIEGYKAFIPNKLPPTPETLMDQETWNLLSQADRALGRLDGATDALPNPDLFVFMYVRKEAVLSSQIEGTQASLFLTISKNIALNTTITFRLFGIVVTGRVG